MRTVYLRELKHEFKIRVSSQMDLGIEIDVSIKFYRDKKCVGHLDQTVRVTFHRTDILKK